MTLTTDEQFDAIVANHLAAIEERLLEATVSSDPFVTEAAAHVVAAGGKRFRPALVVLCALCGERPDEEALTHAALVVELTHVASLYHDD
ncbi:MAG: polyprenyl synthetase family protein, partial [Brooklawnia sp.]